MPFEMNEYQICLNMVYASITLPFSDTNFGKREDINNENGMREHMEVGRARFQVPTIWTMRRNRIS